MSAAVPWASPFFGKIHDELTYEYRPITLLTMQVLKTVFLRRGFPHVDRCAPRMKIELGNPSAIDFGLQFALAGRLGRYKTLCN